MQVTTTRNRPKPFSWSYSKLKNFESCPKRHWHIDINKDVREEESEQLADGNAVHKALAEAISGKAELPKHRKNLQKWVDLITGPVTDQPTDGSTQILVEQQMAITKDLEPDTWFGNNVWYRGIGDVVKITGPVALAVDWKTGKILEDGTQLALMAACIFAHHPQVRAVRTEFIWLREDATTRADFYRDGMAPVWANVLPRVSNLEDAHRNSNFPPKPGALCRKWCPVVACPHNGV